MRKIFVSAEMKYVAVSNQAGEYMLVTGSCRVGTHDRYHADIVREAARELGRLTPDGGGRVLIDHGAKTIKVFGTSGSFGAAPTTIVTDLFRKAMVAEGLEGYSLTVTDTYSSR